MINTDTLRKVFDISRKDAEEVLKEIAKDSSLNIIQCQDVSKMGGTEDSPKIDFLNIGFPSSLQALLTKIQRVFYCGIQVEFEGLLTMYSKKTIISGASINLCAGGIAIGFMKGLFPEMALSVKTRTPGHRAAHIAGIGILMMCPKADAHIKLGTCALTVAEEDNPYRCFDLLQMWPAESKGELMLVDLERGKTFDLVDPIFNAIEEVDTWRRSKPGRFYNNTIRIHRLPYRSGENKLKITEADEDDLNFGREMEIGGLWQALEEHGGLGGVVPKIASLNFISEILHLNTGEREKWTDESQKLEKCLELGNVVVDLTSFMLEYRDNDH